MSILMTLVIALKALNRNKMRTILTMLGMIIGVGAVITMVALGTGAQTKVTGSAAGKPKQQTKPGGANGGGAQAGGGAGANALGTKADPAQGGGVASGSDAASPRLLQPAVAPLSGRLRQFRPGAPPASPEAETATVANTPPLWRPIPDPKPFDPLGVQVGAQRARCQQHEREQQGGGAAAHQQQPVLADAGAVADVSRL
jgi:hypothetical protein